MDKRLLAGVAALLTSLAGCSPAKSYSQTLNIDFSPMYSGYDGVHTYQVPATIANAGVNGVSNVSWSASDTSVVDLAPQPDGVSVMITTKRAGTVTITATTDDAIGKSKLTIAAYTPEQWAAGQARYNSGATVMMGPGGHGDGGVMDGSKYVSCVSCHDPSAASSMATDSGRTVEHTPQQTGGFTDDQMKQIFLDGVLPPSDANPLHISPNRFMSFHTWQASDDEANGLVAFLRSLTPKSQGPLDFGGHGGGGHHGDGGSGPSDGGTH